MMTRKYLGEVAPLGKGRYGLPDHPTHTGAWIGGFRAYDVGKRVYRVDGHYYIENDSQRDARQKP